MNVEELNEIYRLYNLSDRDFKNHLYQSLMEDEKKHIKATLKSTRDTKKKIDLLTDKTYKEKLYPYLETILGSACILYCKTRVFNIEYINDMAEELAIILGSLADPTYITFIIRYLLKKICKCSNGKILVNKGVIQQRRIAGVRLKKSKK